MKRWPRRVTALATTLLVAASTLALPRASAAEVVMAPVRQVGGPGHADLYAWGIATALDGSILVGDYWNFRIERYAADGSYLGTLVDNHGEGETQHQSPYGIAVDPNNGDIVFGDVDGMQLPASLDPFGFGVDRYDASGNYLTSWGTKGAGVGKFKYPSYVAIASNGNVYVADQWDHNVVAHSPDGTELFQFGTNGAGPGQFKQPRGMAFDDQDRLFVTDNYNQRVQVFEADGTYLYEFGGPGQDPGEFGTDLRGIAVDSDNGWVYVAETSLGLISKFDLAGNFITRWGGWGNAPGQFVHGGRNITIDHDNNVWVGDMGAFRAQKFDPNGNFLLQIPDAPTWPPDGGFNQPRGVARDSAGNIFVTDTQNWRVQKFAADGTFLKWWGTRGSDDYKFNYQRGIAVDKNDDSVVVADTDNHKIKKYTNDGDFVWDVGGYGTADYKYQNPHSVDVATDGTIWFVDTQNRRIVALDPDSNFVTAFGTQGNGAGQFQFPRGIDYDETDGTLWITDSVRAVVQHWDTNGTFIEEFGSKGTNGNQFLRPSDLETDGAYIYIADADAHAIKVWRKSDLGYIAELNGGPGSTQLLRPHGLDLDGDRLYVAEQTGERVQEFQLAAGGPPDDTPPDVTVANPSQSEQFGAGEIVMSGTVTDNVGVSSVRVAIKDKDTGLWLTGPGPNDWGGFTYLNAVVDDPGATSSAWSYPWTPPDDGSYALLVEARDTSSNVNPAPKPWVSFSVYSGIVDTIEPDVAVSTPEKNKAYPVGALGMSGTATDAGGSGVASVELAIKNSSTGQWWTGSGWGSFTWNAAILDSPGADITDWTYDFSAAPAGSYGLIARAVDGAGNLDPVKPWVGFAISAGPADNDPPDATVTVPVKGGSYSLGPLDMSGTATDPAGGSGVTNVDVAIKNTTTGQWWTGSGWGAFTLLPATLDSPGTEATGWSFSWNPPSAGSYGVLVRAKDGYGNIDPTKPWHGFTMN